MKIPVDLYPVLKSILWDYHNPFIEEELAIEMYETRWAFVAGFEFTEKEKCLIRHLKEKHNRYIPEIY